jgi:hypothetical protein
LGGVFLHERAMLGSMIHNGSLEVDNLDFSTLHNAINACMAAGRVDCYLPCLEFPTEMVLGGFRIPSDIVEVGNDFWGRRSSIVII